MSNEEELRQQLEQALAQVEQEKQEKRKALARMEGALAKAEQEKIRALAQVEALELQKERALAQVKEEKLEKQIAQDQVQREQDAREREVQREQDAREREVQREQDARERERLERRQAEKRRDQDLREQSKITRDVEAELYNSKRNVERLKTKTEELKKEKLQEKELTDRWKKATKDRQLLARGEYFTPFNLLVDRSTKETYENGFDRICGRMRKGKKNEKTYNRASVWHKHKFRAYQTLLVNLVAKAESEETTADMVDFGSRSVGHIENLSRYSGNANVPANVQAVRDDIALNRRYREQRSSGISRKSSETVTAGTVWNVNVVEEEGRIVTNKGHLFAGNEPCGVTVGIVTQAVIGRDFEAEMDKQINKATHQTGDTTDAEKRLREKKKMILQDLAYHQKDYKGFCHLVNNILQVPKGGHERYFDELCNWIIVPVMPLDDIIDWYHKKGGYWIMFVATNASAYMNFYNASTSRNLEEHVYVPGERERCTQIEVETGIANLTAFIKAFADVATGRGRDAMTPFDLVGRNKPKGLDEIMAARDKLAKAGVVTVPTLSQFDENSTQVLKFFVDDSESEQLPEPMAIASKGALNFMEMIGEKCVPGCAGEQERMVGEKCGPGYGESSPPPATDSWSLADSEVPLPEFRTPANKLTEERWEVPRLVIATPSSDEDDVDDDLTAESDATYGIARRLEMNYPGWM